MKTSQANRGKWFETAIGSTNAAYKRKGVALVNKIPTPISYNTRTKKAFYEAKSTVDFVGIIKGGKHIAFDTKEVDIMRLPFDNVSSHQEEYMTNTQKMGGTAFLLVYFKKKNECYMLDINRYTNYKRASNRKSIPYDWFKDNAVLIRSANGVVFDYMSGVLLGAQSLN